MNSRSNSSFRILHSSFIISAFSPLTVPIRVASIPPLSTRVEANGKGATFLDVHMIMNPKSNRTTVEVMDAAAAAGLRAFAAAGDDSQLLIAGLLGLGPVNSPFAGLDSLFPEAAKRKAADDDDEEETEEEEEETVPVEDDEEEEEEEDAEVEDEDDLDEDDDEDDDDEDEDDDDEFDDPDEDEDDDDFDDDDDDDDFDDDDD
jgi:hypothetical protein